jgi:hypothetical protein
MIDDTFKECNDGDAGEDRLQEAVAATFAIANNIHKEFWSHDGWNEPSFSDLGQGEGLEDGQNADDGDSLNFDPHALEDALRGLYSGAKSSKLASTILLLNLCPVHGVDNYFVDELFSILHGHILPDGNSLPQNHYAAKALTWQLGLAYNTIHACESGCVLFRGKYENLTECPVCEKPRFKD